MTGAEWLAATDPTPMLRLLRGRVSPRKFRLLAVAVARGLAGRLPEDPRGAVGVGERAADGRAADPGRLAFVERLQAVVLDHTGENWFRDTATEDVAANRAAPRAVGEIDPASDVADNSPDRAVARRATADRQPALIRDISGNPIRPIALSPSWLTSTVVALANEMYESRDFSAMPILADALHDAGCDNPDVLGHCRGPGPHVRGCWVVDGLLNKG